MQRLCTRAGIAATAILLSSGAVASAQGPIVDAYGGAGSAPTAVDRPAAPPPAVAPAAPPPAAVNPGSVPPTSSVSQTPVTEGSAVAGETAGPTAGSSDAVPASSAAKPVADVATAPATSRASGGGQLPFTGFDLTLIIAGGLVLLIVGFAARWLASPRPSGI